MSSNLKISKRGINTPASPIRKLSPLAQAAREQGTAVFGLNIGQPDIPSPELYFEGIHAFTAATVAYEPSKGNAQLCAAWSKSMNRSLGTITSPEHFVITSGASEALLYTFMSIADPGDEILFFEPTYGNYLGFASASSVICKAIPANFANGFAIPAISEIEKSITEKTKAIVICNPNNPTGTVTPPAHLQEILALCENRNLFMIVDETYRELVYDGLEFHSVLQDSPRSKNLVIVDSLSKRFSLCGARIGCLITCNEALIESINRFAMTRLSVSTLEQFAAAHLLEKIQGDFLEHARSEYQKRRDTLCNALSRIDGVIFNKPHGAFYLIAKFPVKSAEEFAIFMLKDFSLDNHTTFVAPAAGFYINPGRGLDEIRIAYVLNCGDIEKAVNCLANGLVKFKLPS